MAMPGAGERPSFLSVGPPMDGPLDHPETLKAPGASERKAGESTDGTESLAGFLSLIACLPFLFLPAFSLHFSVSHSCNF